MAVSLSVYTILTCVLSFLCAASGETNCTNVSEICEYRNVTGWYNSTVPCNNLTTFIKQNIGKMSCSHGYRKMNLTALENNRCSSFTVCYDIQCAPNEDVAKSRAEKELLNLKRITAPNSSSAINICARSGPYQECLLNLGSESASSRASRVKVQFRLDDENSSSAVSVGALLSRHKVGKVKNFHIDPGAVLRFGDKAPVVIAVQQGNNLSTKEVKIEFVQLHPLDYIEKSIRVKKVSARCAIYDTEYEAWDPSVCKNPPKVSSPTIKCTCEHNSAFAVMFAVTKIEVDSTLKTVSIAFEVASIVALLATCTLLILYRRKLRNFDRVLVQISLCISLAMAHLFMLLSEAAISNDTFCQAVIIISHYFLVSLAVLMVMEGGIMLTKVLFPNFGQSSHSGRRRAIGFTIAWIVPLVYTGVCAGIGIPNGSYGNYLEDVGRFEVCWITDTFNLVVIIPMAVAVGINALIVIRLGVLVASLSRRAEDFKPSNERDVSPITHAGKAFRAVIILLPILGIPWAIGFLVNTGHPANVVFASIHVVVNGCQGIFIFLHYVVFNSDMKACVRRSWESTKSDMASFSPIVQFTNNRTDSTTTIKLD